VSIEIPISLYTDLESLAAKEQSDPVAVLAQLVAQAREQEDGSWTDPVFDVIGAYHSELPLIDGIPVSEDPDLYLVAEALGDQAVGKHAWELMPMRYMAGQDGRAIRRNAERHEL
jgi:hypothetical protein